jgi:hypothetical protein
MGTGALVGILVGSAWVAGAWYRVMHLRSWWRDRNLIWFTDPWARWVATRVAAGEAPPSDREIICWSAVQMAAGVVFALLLAL